MQTISEFIERWRESGGSERANYALFLNELTEVLGVEKPLPVTEDATHDHYRLERPVASGIAGEGSKKFIDFYRRGSFVLETKQGAQGKQPIPINWRCQPCHRPICQVMLTKGGSRGGLT